MYPPFICFHRPQVEIDAEGSSSLKKNLQPFPGLLYEEERAGRQKYVLPAR